MSSELSRTIATCGIWAAVAMILTFGLYRANMDGFVVIVITGLVMLGATVTSVAVWAPEAFIAKNKLEKVRGFEVVQAAQPLEKVE